MNQVIILLAELFLIGCLHMIINIFVDFEKIQFFQKVFTGACYAGALFLVARFVAVNLLPQMGAIFRVMLP